MVRALGEPAPGDLGLLLPPDPARVAELPYHAFHPWGVERRRAEVLRAIATRATRIEALGELAPAEARERLQRWPGIGPWTAAEAARLALGDADAVSVGDYHLPHLVAWTLAGEARGTDARMLELLATYAGHRGRVQRLLEAGGRAAPRYGPRMPVRSIAPI
jgi:3-methyladenine DNA glycosylase/8-oxoguanine DNA glycosylase